CRCSPCTQPARRPASTSGRAPSTASATSSPAGPPSHQTDRRRGVRHARPHRTPDSHHDPTAPFPVDPDRRRHAPPPPVSLSTPSSAATRSPPGGRIAGAAAPPPLHLDCDSGNGSRRLQPHLRLRNPRTVGPAIPGLPCLLQLRDRPAGGPLVAGVAHRGQPL